MVLRMCSFNSQNNYQRKATKVVRENKQHHYYKFLLSYFTNSFFSSSCSSGLFFFFFFVFAKHVTVSQATGYFLTSFPGSFFFSLGLVTRLLKS